MRNLRRGNGELWAETPPRVIPEAAGYPGPIGREIVESSRISLQHLIAGNRRRHPAAPLNRSRLAVAMHPWPG